MPNLFYSLYCQEHLYGKLEVAGFIYGNSFLQNGSLKTNKVGMFVPKIRLFNFTRNFCILTNSRLLISSMKILFQTCSPKYLNKLFWSQIQLFLLCTIFFISTNSKVLILNVTIIFSNF